MNARALRTFLVIAAVCSASACDWSSPLPTYTQGPSKLDGMYLVTLEWPDTIVAGRIGIATVQLVLSSGVPYEPDYYEFRSPDVRVAGLYPTSRPESKQVLAFTPGRVTITVDTHIENNRAHCTCPGWHAQLTREIVVVPAP